MMIEKVFAKLSTMKMPSESKLLKLSILFFVVVVSATLALLFTKVSPFTKKSSESNLTSKTASQENTYSSVIKEEPASGKEEQIKANEPVLKPQLEVLNPSELFNVLVLGIDRRYQTEESFRTDIIMLATVNPKANKVVFTSIPRDLWAGTVKINGVYVTQGYDAMKAKIKEVTGQDVDRFIRTDFDALVWVVDAMGGVDVNVERTFADSQYPNDRQGDPNQGITVSFTQGKMHMDGETALIFSRSRKGDSGEGSDFSRMRRQQIILKDMPESFLAADPKNIFNPFVLQSFYNLVTQHVKTDMNVKDVGVVYDLLKDRSKYKVEHFVVDYDYLVNPPIEDYGQWVVIPKDGDYTPIHTKINSLLQ